MMKFAHLNFIMALLGLLITLSIVACNNGASQKPARNKMPDLNSFQDFDDPGFSSGAYTSSGSAFGFQSTNIEMETTDGMRSFLNVPLPDPSTDSLAINLVNSMKPLALPLLSSWAMQQKGSGVVLDLCSHRGGSIHQTNYALRQTGGFSIPIIIRWDAGSAYRAAGIRQLVQGIPYVSLQFISGDDPGRASSM